jgi:PPOX class probable F420-dependent enzyme
VSSDPRGSHADDDHLLAPFVRARAVLLRTRKRDGSWVGTPVSIVVEDDHAYFRTFARSGKAKRVRNFPEVEFAPSTFRGRPIGPFVSARATLLRGEPDHHASQLIAGKHPVLHGVFVPLAHRLQRQETQHYELTEIKP